MMRIGIIGGSGVYDVDELKNISENNLITPFGIFEYIMGEYENKEVVFVTRHGKGHTLPPHMISYKKIIWGMKELGVEKIIATSASGSLNLNMKPGDFVIIDQFIDFTDSREITFFDTPGNVVHTDMTEPYCEYLRILIKDIMMALNLSFHEKGTYVTMNGPRYETKAEINMLKILGGDIVGMTGTPEVILANEMKICYASIGIVTNFAAGISDKKISHEEVIEMMDKKIPILKKVIFEVIKKIDINK
ncbi:MAG TPA: S-methyl-5'-thioadenosine phosphorylase [Caldisericia bacterium]|nr:S-methyl-5'-thioadenosine phosphorylase [bacterium]HOK17650.1 S-methyl-5'-thioadenosine phosphorylase [Caldisericia bacterium]HPP43028.1 S-methyl-5'-thioadenosine phosphorylase [Caldisericia bacterium]